MIWLLHKMIEHKKAEPIGFEMKEPIFILRKSVKTI